MPHCHSSCHRSRHGFRFCSTGNTKDVCSTTNTYARYNVCILGRICCPRLTAQLQIYHWHAPSMIQGHWWWLHCHQSLSQIIVFSPTLPSISSTTSSHYTLIQIDMGSDCVLNDSPYVLQKHEVDARGLPLNQDCSAEKRDWTSLL